MRNKLQFFFHKKYCTNMLLMKDYEIDNLTGVIVGLAEKNSWV